MSIFQENFKNFLDTIDKNELLEALIQQAGSLAKENLPTKTDNPIVTQPLIEQWVSCNVWCQILTAHIILELTQSLAVTPKDVECLFVIYKVSKTWKEK